MPGPLIGVFLILLGAGTSLLGPPAMWRGVDPNVNRGHYRPEKWTPRVWHSSPRIDADGDCEFTVFAMTGRQEIRRLQVAGQEQLLDWSWSWPVTVEKGESVSDLEVRFIHPVTRDTRQVTVFLVCPGREVQ